MRKVDGLSRMFIDFFIPALRPRLNSTTTLLQLSENITLFAVLTVFFSVIISLHGRGRIHRSSLSFISVGTCLFAKALPSNCCVYLFFKNLLRNSGSSFVFCLQVVK
jgi:hypothetical protein